MRFRVDDLIYNEITQEQGRVVRILEKNNAVSYVVIVPASPLREEREALWRQYEVKERNERQGIITNPPLNESSSSF